MIPHHRSAERVSRGALKFNVHGTYCVRFCHGEGVGIVGATIVEVAVADVREGGLVDGTQGLCESNSDSMILIPSPEMNLYRVASFNWHSQ